MQRNRLKRSKDHVRPAVAPPSSVHVRCLCGGSISVPPSDPDDIHNCPRCNRRFNLVIEGNAPFPVYLDDGSEITPPPAADPPELPDQIVVVCQCNTTMRIRKESFGKTLRCKICSARLQLRVEPDPAGGMRVVPIAYVDLPCSCNAMVSLPKLAGHGVRCRQCGRLVTLFLPEDGDPVAVVLDAKPAIVR